MIRKLRFRLVLASMLSLFFVLAVMMAGLNGMNYRRIVKDSDGVLSLLRDNGGAFPSIGDDFEWPERGPRYRSPELPFEMRFFSVLLDQEGNVLETDTERIAAVDANAAQAHARAVFESGGTAGFRGIYRYLRYEETDGNIRVIFLDCGRQTAQFYGILRRTRILRRIRKSQRRLCRQNGCGQDHDHPYHCCKFRPHMLSPCYLFQQIH